MFPLCDVLGQDFQVKAFLTKHRHSLQLSVILMFLAERCIIKWTVIVDLTVNLVPVSEFLFAEWAGHICSFVEMPLFSKSMI